MNMKFYIVDAFTKTPFGGNTAGVMVLDPHQEFPGEEQMQKVASELRYSETAFIRPGPAEGGAATRIFETRYFTPEGEVDLCGHATIAAFSVLAEEGILHQGDLVTNKTLAGDLRIQVTSDGILMEMASPCIFRVYETKPELQVLGRIMGEAEHTRILAEGLLPMVVSTGLSDILLPVASQTLLSRLQPDMEALSDYSRDHHVVGVHAFALMPQGSGYTAVCRNFAPLYGIPEEAATGTSNGALAYYLYHHGLLPEGQAARFLQGVEMGRPSEILGTVTRETDRDVVVVGGTSVLLCQGTFFL